jgi:hypothetical protein
MGGLTKGRDARNGGGRKRPVCKGHISVGWCGVETGGGARTPRVPQIVRTKWWEGSCENAPLSSALFAPRKWRGERERGDGKQSLPFPHPASFCVALLHQGEQGTRTGGCPTKGGCTQTRGTPDKKEEGEGQLACLRVVPFRIRRCLQAPPHKIKA